MSDLYTNLSFEEIDPLDIPSEIILDHPVVKDLANSGSLDGLVPLVLKNKRLMSPGLWNDNYYPKEAITDAYKNTDWSDRHVTALFLDHEDERTSEWVGEVKNIRLDEKTGDLYGDLYIYDLPTAIKLKYGKPKIGISPSLKINKPMDSSVAESFIFRNFSLVIHPAVKTTYLNNAQDSFTVKEVERMAGEEKVEVKQSEEEKPEEKKEEQPTQEEPKEAETQPAAGTVSETKVEDEEMAKKKKKYPYPEEEENKEEDEEMSAYTDFVKKMRKKGWSFEKIAKAWKAKKLAEELSEEELEILEEELKKKKKKKEEYPYPNPDLSELEKKIENMSEKISKLADEPVRLSVKTGVSTSATNVDLSRDYSEKEADRMMLEYLKKEMGVTE